MYRVGFLGLALVACGDQEQQIIVNVFMQTPALVTVNTDGTWRTPEQSGPRQYAFAASGDYKFIAGCDNDDGTFFVGEVVGRPDPQIIGWNIFPQTLSVGGCNAPSGSEVLVDIAGTVSQQANVSALGYRTESAQNAATWDYVLHVPPGVHDLFATDPVAADKHFVRRPDVDMGASSVQPPIDLVAESLPMLTPQIQVNGVTAGMATTTTTTLYPPIGSIDISQGSDSSFTVVDPSRLDADDEQVVMLHGVTNLDATSPDVADVTAQARFSSDLGPVELPPLLEPSFHEAPNGLFANWGTLTDFSYAELSVSDLMSESSVLVISQRDYAFAQGQIGFEAPPDFPVRWMPSWTHQLVDSYRLLSVDSSDASWSYTSSVFSENDDKSVRRKPSPVGRIRTLIAP